MTEERPRRTVYVSRDASGRLQAELDTAPRAAYENLCATIAVRFGLSPVSRLIEGVDEVFQDYASGDCTIGLEWDTWSRFSVVAKTRESEPLLREIVAFLETAADDDRDPSGRTR